jgi:hypothetical protein
VQALEASPSLLDGDAPGEVGGRKRTLSAVSDEEIQLQPGAAGEADHDR